MSEDLVTIEINGRSLEAPEGSMLIAAADAAGINIPRFCYHPRLSVAANCRMCLVEVEQSGKPLPACATPVADGMKVWTQSAKAHAAQQDIMEFLLINHPLDCPICDQGGECELQDVSLGYGKGSSQYAEVKRAVLDKNIGPLIETEMTRCIHCTRCVRFGEEIAGLRELGATGRSEHMEIGTYIEKAVSSELSGNVIDLCPVGALTAKPSRYQARAWEMQAHPAIAPHDSVGSNLEVHTFDGKVIRVVPAENEAINECWISDRDRFSYQGLHSRERLIRPQIKHDGQWQEVSWQQALQTVADILRKTPANAGAGLASPNTTLEELYLFQKLMRGAGFNNIDHRLRQVDFADQEQVSIAPVLGVSIAGLEQQQAVFMVGANPRQDQPMLNHRLRKAALAGGHIMALNPRAVDFNYPVYQHVVKPWDLVLVMGGIIRAISEQADKLLPDNVVDLCAQVELSETDRVIARHLLEAERPLILLGNMAFQHPHLSRLRALSEVVTQLTGAVSGYLLESSNTVGAALAGVLPHRLAAGTRAPEPGLPVNEMLSADLQTYVLLNAESDDFANPYQAAAAFQQAAHVISISPFVSEQMRELATVLLPASSFTESAGTYVNCSGEWQTFQGVTQPPGEARPGWKILRVLGNKLDLPGFDYVSPQEVVAELKLELQLTKPGNQYTSAAAITLPPGQEGMQRIGDVQMYRSDGLVRRAEALQAMIPEPLVRLNPQDMEVLGLEDNDLVKASQGQGSVQLPAQADVSVPCGCVWIQSGIEAANALGDAFGPIEVDRV